MEASKPVANGDKYGSNNGSNGSNGNNGGAAREPDRDEALREAQQCLDLLREEDFLLDGFNLLGIVANPGGPAHPSSHPSSHPPRSPAAPQPPSGAPATATTPAAGAGETDAAPATAAGDADPNASYYSEYLSGTVQSLEQTLGQVTEQIDTLNMFLEELSKEYLGEYGDETAHLEYYLSQEEEEEELDITGIPRELLNTTTGADTVRSYLAQSGALADSLKNNELRPSPHVLPNPEMPHIVMARNTIEDDQSQAASTHDKVEALLKHLPPLIVNPDLDLTDPSAFARLIMGKDLDQISEVPAAKSFAKRPMSVKESMLQPTTELVAAIDHETFVHHLEKVELALLEQVREKSGAFFQETTRFRQLSTGVIGLLGQTSKLRRVVRSVLDSYSGVGDIPSLDQARGKLDTLQCVLEQIVDLLNVKGSIGGLVSANDHFGAAEQIQYGQSLLLGKTDETADAANAESTANGIAARPSDIARLDQLNALRSCGEQFKQYQSLVAQNLSEEITEIFLNWTIPPPGRTSTQDTSRVVGMVEALRMCNSWNSAGQVYIKRMHQTLRMTVRTTIAEFVDSNKTNKKGGGGGGVVKMPYASFSKCLDMLLEELLRILHAAKAVDDFCLANNVFDDDENSPENGTTKHQANAANGSKQSTCQRWTMEAVATGVEIASEDIARILRQRREAHSLIALDDMRRLWDRCSDFSTQVEKLSKTKANGLKSTLVGQAKAFLERAHERNMSALAAAMESERWTQCEVSSERQDALTRLCSGRAVVSNSQRRRNAEDATSNTTVARNPTAIVEGKEYRVVWSCLLLVEMVMTNISAAAHFQTLAANAVGKVSELLRLFTTRATQLVLNAGAMHSAARLKSINAKHLSMVTRSLGMMLVLFPHIRAALMAQLLPKQHALLNDLDTIRGAYVDHNEKVMNKFVIIIGGIVERGLAPTIASTNFDARGKELPENEIGDKANKCCAFMDGVITSTKKLHQVLSNLLPPDNLQDVFSRIFAYVDEKVPAILIAADSASSSTSTAKNAKTPTQRFAFPSTEPGKRRLLLELQHMTLQLNGLEGVLGWDFSAVGIIEGRIDCQLNPPMEEEEDGERIDNGDADAVAATENGDAAESVDKDGAKPNGGDEKKEESETQPSSENQDSKKEAEEQKQPNGNADSSAEVESKAD